MAAEMLTILVGDALEKLCHLPDESVQCCVTSPPYWGLRDYGTAKWDGGAEECDHAAAKLKSRYDYSLASSPIQDGSRTGTDAPRYKDQCPCGAKRIDAQLGLEKTPEEYVARMVGIFREVRRVLRKDGTLWLNLGDSYNANQGAGFDTNKDGGERKRLAASPRIKWGKPKDLVGIPWRVAFALQSDGWWLRSDIIWAKPNPMPESVTDRPTKSHEYIFLLTKSARYFYDAEAIAEGFADERMGNPGRYVRTTQAYKGANNDRGDLGFLGNGGGWNTDGAVANRNKRSVWRVATNPYPDAHFATYPPDLIKPCILAGSRPGDVVLDPFAGSGTSGMVALELGRRAILIELNPKYVALIEARTNITLGLALT